MINAYLDTGRVTAVCDRCGREWINGLPGETATQLLDRAISAGNPWSPGLGPDGARELLGPLCTVRARRAAEQAARGEDTHNRSR